jgi:hypothetical protein
VKGDSMRVLEKNDYLRGLEKLYKKYNINEVYTYGRGHATYSCDDYCVKEDLSIEALEELADYMENPNDHDIYSLHYSNCDSHMYNLNLFYKNGVFYGGYANAH